MKSGTADVEVRFRWLASVAVLLFGTILGVGLVLHVLRPGSAIAATTLDAGLILLMAAPVVRLTLALIERIRRRDRLFVAMTLAVVFELAIVMWRAAQKL